jgi:hypothetical protein
MHVHLIDIALFVGTFFAGILQKIFRDTIADKVSDCLRWLFVHSERQAIYYIHYRDKHMKNRGHNYKRPHDCYEGHCRLV